MNAQDALRLNLRGAAIMMASMAGFVINDAFMRIVLRADMPLFQAVALRGLPLVLFLGVVAWHSGGFKVRPSRREHKLIGWRAVAEIGANISFLTALSLIPFASVSAILQALPLTVTLAAAVFLAEPVGWRRLTAILVGLAGVLIIVRPGGEEFGIGAIAAVLAVISVTFRDLTARVLGKEVSSSYVAFLTAIIVVSFGGVASMFVEWSPIEPWQLAYLTGSAVALSVAYVASVSAMRIGDIAFIAPFRYTILLWAILLGIVIFDEIPDQWTMVGAAIVVRPGAAVTADEIRGHCRERIAGFKVPRYIWLREELLPRNASGKFLKRQLRDDLDTADAT